MGEKVFAEASLTLAELSQTAAQNEGIFGPLEAIADENEMTALTFRVADSPANRVVIEAYDAEHAPAKSGHVIVCEGSARFKSSAGQIVSSKVAGYRQS